MRNSANKKDTRRREKQIRVSLLKSVRNQRTVEDGKYILSSSAEEIKEDL